MQNYCKTIGALAAASALVAGNANAEVEYELHTGYSSQYVFRGVDLGDDLFEVGLDAAYEWNGLSVSAGVWATAFDGAFASGNDIDSENDFYGEISKDLGFVTASVGYIYYWNVNNTRGSIDNQEVYFGISRDLGFASASLTYFWDVDSTNSGDTDGYTELALNRAFELNQCLTLNVGGNIGYLIEGGDFTAATAKVSLDWGFAENAKLSPFAAVSFGLGDSANTLWNSTENEFTAGTMLAVGF